MPLSSGGFFVCVSVPENPPVNVTAVLNGTEVLMMWEVPPGKLNGELQGFVVEYSTPAAQQVGLRHTTRHTQVKRKSSLCPILTVYFFSL